MIVRIKRVIGYYLRLYLIGIGSHRRHSCQFLRYYLRCYLNGKCSIPDNHIDPRRSALFMARSVLRDIQMGDANVCSTS